MNTVIAHRIKWIATVVTLAGAVFASIDIYPLSAITLNSGAFLFLIWAVLIREPAMIAVNGGLLAIYTIGLAIKLL